MKKALSVALLGALALTAVGGTFAYFTDTDKATNTFVAGGVGIELIEQQRDPDAATPTLEAFEQEKELFPIVGSAQGEKDTLGLPIAENFVDKVVTIKNTGKTEAWIRAYFAIPSDLDDGYETFNAGMNVLHFNFGNKVAEDGAISTTYQTEWIWKVGDTWNYFETTMDGVKYNVYYADYFEAIDANETTVRLIDGIYLDKSVNYVQDDLTTNDVIEEGYYAFNQKLELTNGTNMAKIDCPVFAVAVQKEGFDNAKDAVEEAFGKKYNPWGTSVENWQE